jgi:hypothetical protein
MDTVLASEASSSESVSWPDYSIYSMDGWMDDFIYADPSL